MKVPAFLTCFIMSAATVFAAGSATINGSWKTEENKSKVEIFQCAEKICGKITWMKEPLYTEAKEGPIGKPKLDHNNPEVSLKSRPLLGLQIMEGFTVSGDDAWANGTIYDPENGKTYKCKMKMTSPERLEVRGYIGISLIGRTAVWTR